MALTRKFLTALGIDADKVDEIINAHTAVTDELKTERDKYKADADKLKDTEAKLAKATTELEDAKKQLGGENPFEKKYNDLKAEHDKYKADVQAKETKAAKEKAYSNMLKEIGIADKRIDSVLKVTNLEAVELDEKGALKAKDELVKAAKAEWADFIPTRTQTGANTQTPPANGAATTKSWKEITEIKNTTERQAAMKAYLQNGGQINGN